ncbi:MAG: gliding motility-associated C-terminal domain-containing protein [Chitinophagales bacterium]
MYRLVLTLGLLFNMLTALAQSPGCNQALIRSTLTSAGWTEVVNVSNTPCSMYFVKTTPMDANAAEPIAQTFGAHMAVMNDVTENFWVKVALQAQGFFNSYNVWIGTTDQAVEGTFVNLDGTPLTFTQWAPGEPNNDLTQPGCSSCSLPSPFGCSGSYQCTYGEDCVQLTTSATWNDLACQGANGIPMIEVNLCPVMTKPRDTTICPSNSVTLSTSTLLGSQPYTYNWSNGATGATISASPSTGTNYVVTVTDRYGCSATSNGNVNISGSSVNPIFTFNPATGACVNQPVTVALTAPNGSASYSWNFGGATVLSGSGAGPYSISWAGSGTKTVDATATFGGCTSPFSASIPVYNLPTAAAGSDQPVCPGTPLTIGTTPFSGVTYSWSPADSLSNAASATPTFSASQNGTGSVQNFQYILTATQNGCSSKDTIVLALQPNLDNSFSIDTNSVCTGSPVIVQATGSNPVSALYNWNFNGGIATGSGAGPYSVKWNSSGVKTITLSVSNNTCNSASSSKTVTVSNSVVANTGTDQYLCAGNTATLGAASVSGVSYQWTPADSLSNSTISNPVYSATSNHTGDSVVTKYVLTAVANGCLSTDTVKVTLYPSIENTFTIDSPTACVNQDVTITATGVNPGNPAYNWNFNGGIATGSGAGPYQVHWTTNGVKNVTLAVNNNGCSAPASSHNITIGNVISANAGRDTTICSGTTLHLGSAPQSGVTYQWSPGAGLSSTSISNPNFLLHNTSGSVQTLIYSVTATLGGCSGSDDVTVTLQPATATTISASAPLNFCAGDSVILSAPAFTTYSWNNGSSSSAITVLNSGTYQFSATDNLNCDFYSNIVTVNVFPLPKIITAPNGVADESCYGQNDGSISVSAISGTGPFQFQWSTTPPQTGAAIAPLAPGNYSVTVTDANNCVDTANYTIVAAPVFDLSVNQHKNVSCFGYNDGAITVSAIGGKAPVTFLWNNGSSLPQLQSLASDTYSVTLTDQSGCVADTALIITQPQQVVASTPDSITVFYGEQKQLPLSVSPDTSSYYYLWSPDDDLNCAACANPKVTPVRSAYYQVIVTDQHNGCKDTAKIFVTLDPAKHIFAATAFTPNNDGVNDVFHAFAPGAVQTYEFQIFDRWGNSVYLSNNPDGGWDGTYRGNPAGTGVYVYDVKVTFQDGDSAVKSGTVTLLR